MPHRVPPIARIRLARSLPRLLIVPLAVATAGGLAAAAGLLATGGIPGLALAVLGGILVVGAILGAMVLLSVRLEVEESAVGVEWFGGERIYPLTPGPVTRVRLRGEGASRLRSRFGALGWGIGRARLRGEEEIEVVRLALTATAILVPTERGRLAIAPADQDELLDALSRAARARQRLEALADRMPPVEESEPLPAESAAELPAPGMTGIERAILQRRLDDERVAATSSADAEPVAAALPMPTPASEAVPAESGAQALRPSRRRRIASRLSLRRPRPAAAFVLLPIVGAGVAWLTGISVGSMPQPGTDLARITSLALVLAGPATSVGAIMALAWWPRLVGVVVAGGLAASVLIGRALIGA